jgi:hypothetical protein
MKRRSLPRLAALSVVLIVGGCVAGGSTPSSQSDQDKELQRLLALHDEHQKSLDAMDVPALAAELVKDANRGREPFNSSAFAEMVSRRESAGQLAGLIRTGDRSSLLELLAVRQMDAGIYGQLPQEQRIAILVDALRTAETFNSWGLPHLYWEEPARAIIDEGQAAELALGPLLSDKRPAPMWGEDEVVESRAYQYRVMDYALALILAIRKSDQVIPIDPADRDRLIAGL